MEPNLHLANLIQILAEHVTLWRQRHVSNTYRSTGPAENSLLTILLHSEAFCQLFNSSEIILVQLFFCKKKTTCIIQLKLSNSEIKIDYKVQLYVIRRTEISTPWPSTKHVQLQHQHTVKPLILATLNFQDLIYNLHVLHYFGALNFRVLLAGLSNTLK